MIAGSSLASRFNMLTSLSLVPLFWHKGGIGTGASWTDLSPNGNHQLQATGSKQPTTVANALGTASAKLYDGVDDFTQATFAWNQPCHIFSVHKLITIGAINIQDFVWEGTSATSALLIECNSGGNQTIAGAGTNQNYTAEVCTSSFKLHNIKYNGATSRARIQGGQLIAADMGAQNMGGLTLGGRFNGTRNTNVSFLEVVGFQGLLTAADEVLLENYFRIGYQL